MRLLAISTIIFAASIFVAPGQGGKKTAGDDPTYSRDIAPVFAKKCTPCHVADGPGPFPLDTYTQVKNRSALIRYILFSKKMPPLSGQSEMGHLRTIEPLTNGELLRFQEWMQAGMLPGDEVKGGAKPIAWPMGPPDLVLSGGKGETVAAEGAPYSKEIRIPAEWKENLRIRAIEFRPKTPKSWRRALVAKAYPLDAKKSVWNPTGLPAGRLIGGWSLGAMPWALPTGGAIELTPKDDLAVIPLWQPSGKPENGEFEIGIYLAKDSPKVPHWITMGKADFTIPPQDGFTELTDSTVMSEDADLISVLPEARLFCRMIRLEVVLPTGEHHVAFMVRNWDWEWAGAYNFEKPVRLPKGTRLNLSFTYDNSGHALGTERTDPFPLKFGGTLDHELFWCHLQLIPVEAK